MHSYALMHIWKFGKSYCWLPLRIWNENWKTLFQYPPQKILWKAQLPCYVTAFHNCSSWGSPTFSFIWNIISSLIVQFQFCLIIGIKQHVRPLHTSKDATKYSWKQYVFPGVSSKQYWCWNIEKTALTKETFGSYFESSVYPINMRCIEPTTWKLLLRSFRPEGYFWTSFVESGRTEFHSYKQEQNTLMKSFCKLYKY